MLLYILSIMLSTANYASESKSVQIDVLFSKVLWIIIKYLKISTFMSSFISTILLSSYLSFLFVHGYF